MKKTVSKKGQKFFHQGRELTAKEFCGMSGIPFDSVEEAEKNNTDGSVIGVKNKEFDGFSNVEESYKKDTNDN